MKNIIAKLCLYGILSTVYITASFFGILYPQYGIPEEAVVYSEKYDEVTDEIPPDESEMIYKSYFWEKLSKLI